MADQTQTPTPATDTTPTTAAPTAASTSGLTMRDYGMIALGAIFPEAMQAYATYKQVKQQDIDNERKNDAYRVIMSQYGPAAGAPDAWATDVRTQGEATAQRSSAVLDALKAIQGVAPATTPGQPTPAAQAYQQSSAQSASGMQNDGSPQPDAISGPAIAAAQQGNTQAQSQLAIAAGRKVASGIINGQDPGEAFDSIAPILPIMGVTPQDAVTLRATVTKDPGSVYNLISALTQQQRANASRANGIAIGSPQVVTINGRPALGYAGQDSMFHVLKTANGEDVVPYAYEHDIQSTNRTAMAQAGANARAYAPRTDTESYVVPTGNGTYVKQAAPYTPAVAGQLTQKQYSDIPRDAEKIAQAGDALDSFDRAAATARSIVKSGQATGLVGAATERIPGTPAFNFARARDTIIGNAAIKTIVGMKDSSRTGATGFGQLNEHELEVVKSQYASLQRGMSADATIAAINQISRVLHNAYSRNNTQFYNTYKMTPQQYWTQSSPAFSAQPTAAPQAAPRKARKLNIGNGITMQQVQ